MNNFLKSRFVELAFATGIPLVGFFSCCGPGRILPGLAWMYPLLLLAGWHILVVNDIFFDRKCSKLRAWQVIPLAVVPVILIFAGMYRQSLVTFLFLAIINWNLYSYSGKRNWLTGLLHNTAGGFLHYLAGVAGAGGDISSQIPQALFFALAMTSGAMHHDASHVLEDTMLKYVTGAVRFGDCRWWRLGIVPMALSAVPLCLSIKLFRECFLASLVPYAILYLAMYTGIGRPDWKMAFRISCRFIFAAAAAAFISMRLFAILGEGNG